MSDRELRERGDVFVRRLGRLLRYVAADPYLNMYYFYDYFSPEMVFELEDIPGFRLVSDGRPAPGSIRGGESYAFRYWCWGVSDRGREGNS